MVTATVQLEASSDESPHPIAISYKILVPLTVYIGMPGAQQAVQKHNEYEWQFLLKRAGEIELLEDTTNVPKGHSWITIFRFTICGWPQKGL